MLHAILNVLLVLLIAAAAGGGIALFVIAKQDDSRTGRILGLAIAIVSLAAGIYLTLSGHWLKV